MEPSKPMVAEGAPGLVESIVTLLVTVVLTLPAASVADALRVCTPSDKA